MPAPPFRLGWEEWIALPELGLPALKVKVDTGARTSALHAYDIEPFGPARAPKVRFMMHPIPSRPDLAIACSAAVTDRREVTSSNGETELRYVIETPMQVGGRAWNVELTLTDRGTMAYRMLLGRQAFPEDVVVVPGDSFCQPQLDYDAYRASPMQAAAPDRALRIAVLGETEASPWLRRVLAEGEARGHAVRLVDPRRCYMTLDTLAPGIHCDGDRLPRFDAVLPQLGPAPGPYAMAVLRQFESIGTWCVNPATGLAALGDRLQAHQLLARRKIATPDTAFAAGPGDPADPVALVGRAPLLVRPLDASRDTGIHAPTRDVAAAVAEAMSELGSGFLVQEASEADALRCLVMGPRVVVALKRPSGAGVRSVRAKLTRAEREIALRTARAFGLGLAEITLRRGADGPQVLGIDACPGLDEIETATGQSPYAALLDTIEKRARPAPIRRPGKARQRNAS